MQILRKTYREERWQVKKVIRKEEKRSSCRKSKNKLQVILVRLAREKEKPEDHKDEREGWSSS